MPSLPAAAVARSVRRPFRSKASPGMSSRCSNVVTFSGVPGVLKSWAVPRTCTVPGGSEVPSGALVVAKCTVTSCTVVSSMTTAPVTVLSAVVRTRSPARISGVFVSQHPPPGWLMSTTPSKTGVAGSSCGIMSCDEMTLPVKRWITSTRTTSFGSKPDVDTKDRDGNTRIWWGASGGLLIATPAGGDAGGDGGAVWAPAGPTARGARARGSGNSWAASNTPARVRLRVFDIVSRSSSPCARVQGRLGAVPN